MLISKSQMVTVQSHTIHRSHRRRRTQSELLPTAKRVVIVMIIFCTLLTTGFTFYPEWVRLSDMKHDLAKEKAHLEECQKLAKERELEVELLQNDPKYLETIARDRLDLMKEGETIFRLSSTPRHSHS